MTPAPAAPGGPGRLFWILWPPIAALPWLLPTHTNPWPVFYTEACTAFMTLFVAFWVLVGTRGRWTIGPLAGAAFALAAVPLLQAAAGVFVFAREAWIVAAYIAATAAALALGHRAEAVFPGRLAGAVFASLTIAAAVSTAITITQWLGIDTLGLLVAPPVAGGRPAANLGQPNNLATLIVWGLLGLWLAQLRGRLGSPAALVLAAFLLVGVALTQSRTGWLAVALLVAAAGLGRRVLFARPAHAGAVFALGLWFAVVVLVQEPLGRALMHAAPLTLDEQLGAGKRPLIWALALDAIGQRPWLGWGWNQSLAAHLALASKYPALQIPVPYAHNAVLDLLLWNGVPLGLAVAGGLGWWFWRQARAPLEPTRLVLLLALATFGLHAMLELPHAYLFFLLPAALFAGTLEAQRPVGPSVALPRAAVAVVLLGFGALGAQIFADYSRIEDDLLRYRMREANIGIKPPPPPPEPVVLQPLQAALVSLRTVPRAAMPAHEIESLRRTLTRYPSRGGLYRYAQASALNQRSDEAAWALARLCDLHKAADCAAAQQDWRDWAAGHPAAAAPPFPARAVAPAHR